VSKALTRESLDEQTAELALLERDSELLDADAAASRVAQALEAWERVAPFVPNDDGEPARFAFSIGANR